MVRESSWYALGLLLRDQPGDRQRAAEILDAVLKEQYVKPGVRWYGTYQRTPEEPDPTPEDCDLAQLRSQLAHLHRHYFCDDSDRVSGPSFARVAEAHV